MLTRCNSCIRRTLACCNSCISNVHHRPRTFTSGYRGLIEHLPSAPSARRSFKKFVMYLPVAHHRRRAVLRGRSIGAHHSTYSSGRKPSHRWWKLLVDPPMYHASGAGSSSPFVSSNSLLLRTLYLLRFCSINQISLSSSVVLPSSGGECSIMKSISKNCLFFLVRDMSSCCIHSCVYLDIIDEIRKTV